jgi:hypothetical protein
VDPLSPAGLLASSDWVIVCDVSDMAWPLCNDLSMLYSFHDTLESVMCQ